MNQNTFTTALFEILEETFDIHHGIYLDKGTSLLPTLDNVTAAEASSAAGAGCATVAAQVAHVTYYLEVLERYISTGKIGDVDWRLIWRTVSSVTPDEWVTLTRALRERSTAVRTMLRDRETWDDTAAGGAFALVAHTAYHLGSLRQALCAIRSRQA